AARCAQLRRGAPRLRQGRAVAARARSARPTAACRAGPRLRRLRRRDRRLREGRAVAAGAASAGRAQ
ncbi:unnamed protein product, partial [Prorocentrum cordatum]